MAEKFGLSAEKLVFVLMNPGTSLHKDQGPVLVAEIIWMHKVTYTEAMEQSCGQRECLGWMLCLQLVYSLKSFRTQPKCIGMPSNKSWYTYMTQKITG